jgi:hypothetical protein
MGSLAERMLIYLPSYAAPEMLAGKKYTGSGILITSAQPAAY